MTAPALQLDLEKIRRRKEWTRTDCEFPNRQARPIMHAIDFLNAKLFHHAIFAHLATATAAFFRGLENHHNCAVEIACLA